MRRFLAWVVVLAVAVVVVGALALHFDLSALPEPGATETALATRAKSFLIERASQQSVPAEPASSPGSVAQGQALFGVECSLCHGASGRKPTDNGRWMYPRAADLGSPPVQDYSDAALFWIIKNGVRLSGMPAFGRVETDAHIWDLVHYTRTLRNAPAASPASGS
jgi:mono/diheme cytochrome c family protein